jgi:threonine synthase
MTIATYHCPICGSNFSAAQPLWRCSCGGPLDLAPGPGLNRHDIVATEASLWRYAAALAVRDTPRVSLGEGWTPLLQRDWAGIPVWFKLESQMPTGSFKDRGTALMVNHLIEIGTGPIHEDSSGNAGASLATYAAAAGIPCRIYVPASAPRAKLTQIAAAGAELRPVAGPREAVSNAALAAAGESFYASHNWHPYFIEGTQTLAFELWEQLGFRAPDNVLVPTGYGSNILGLERGFAALMRGGEISRGPRLYAVQAANCAAFAAAWSAGMEALAPFAAGPTLADGIATQRPVRPKSVLRALRQSQGGVVAVSEDEIVAALRALGRLGLFVEPTAATAGAALSRLLQQRRVTPEQMTVVVLTGHGLKAAERIADLFALGSAEASRAEDGKA